MEDVNRANLRRGKKFLEVVACPHGETFVIEIDNRPRWSIPPADDEIQCCKI